MRDSAMAAPLGVTSPWGFAMDGGASAESASPGPVLAAQASRFELRIVFRRGCDLDRACIHRLLCVHRKDDGRECLHAILQSRFRAYSISI